MSEKQTAYRVLARKYRPQNFGELIGQDALVRTLKNAIETNRVAHAFMLTGVRGVGKTTTARIIAKALNYKGPDGKAGPTTGPTDDCPLCRTIAEDRHPDIIEMDAASRTGVDDIREILDGVRYAPTEARYKIYIIDEVHMLSKNAFNALLKTLEEPPPHVKFIFATTEIRKVPVTVLSRCQRFDLRRVSAETLHDHYLKICGLEKVEAEKEAIDIIARAADGSVRDGLSLLDQAIALGGDKVTTQQVQSMLGLADRSRNLDLLEKALSGDMPGALEIMADLHNNGSAPIAVIQDLLDLTHLLTKLRILPNSPEVKQTLAGDQIARAQDLASKLSMPTLGKTWQILLKGISEVNEALNPQTAAEMILIRLAYAADLPDPADLIKRLQSENFAPAAPSHSSAAAPPAGQSRVTARSGNAVPAHNPVPNTEYETSAVLVPTPQTFPDIIAFLEASGEYVLANQLYQFAHLVRFEYLNQNDSPSGHIEFRPALEASPKLAHDLGQKLKTLTNQRWMITLSSATGQPTLAEQKSALQQRKLDEVLKLPAIREIIEIFPEAKLVKLSEKG